MTKNFFTKQDINLNDLKNICNNQLKLADLAFAKEVEKNIPIYLGRELLTNYLGQNKLKLKNEIHFILKAGPGVLAIKNFFFEKELMDKKNEIFYKIIEREKKASTSDKGDHFGNAHTNERIWNSFEKTGLEDPPIFFNYYKNPLFNLVNEAWLGPFSSITAQVNIVKPGGKPQVAHRDYHLGFQDDNTIKQFPLNVQTTSQFLTLQGAIAHSDVPIKSGSTYLLPFSQQYELGYLAFRNKDFIDYFNENYVQIPLQKGDAIFFNPALFHAAGENFTSDVFRIANLIQTSSAFGKTMEYIDYDRLLKKLYPCLIENRDDPYLDYLVKNTAPAYAFPTNLDSNQPISGNSPLSCYDLLVEHLNKQSDLETFKRALEKFYHDKRLVE